MIAMVMVGLPWLLSGLTIWVNLLAGSKLRYAWALGLLAQALWLVWILLTWEVNKGLLPMNLALWIVYWRNHRRWQRVEPMPEAPKTWLRRRMWAGEWRPWQECTEAEARVVHGLKSWEVRPATPPVQRRSNGVG